MRKILALMLCGAIGLSAVACGQTEMVTTETSETVETEGTTAEAEATSTGTVDNSFAEDTDALVEAYTDVFEQVEYTDDETGLTVTYNIYLPEGYDASEEYPMVVFIADSSCAGDDATKSLTQGRGALVWASDEWQAANPSIVLVPTYPETILDDQNGYSTTEYVELTKRLIDDVSEEYAVDTDRIYGTGQSMGCMTTLILASEYPDLYAACMFVDGQWDVSTLSSLEDQTFIYFAAEDDQNAYNGMQEVMEMFDEDGVDYTYDQWDGTWTPDELSEATAELLAGGTKAYFVSWASGTIEAGSQTSFAGPNSSSDDSERPALDADNEKPEMLEDAKSQEAGEKTEGGKGNGQGGMNAGGDDSMMQSVQYHMASFDYAYRCVAVMEWLFEN
ncbi:MAG: prolyl oligopeptidase family serine peptidase [Pseudobutyrivibrio sp.]|uniref:carboxylesterase family protein n=1 Tax=Pseudobutyrivibrio sp. TaxID=2014367 RepID=UPI0025EA0EC7|nr:alpha/beta hydrolase-fold protein [Pseudobutyrivibrio sp.]MBQ8490473.1 prolyl oligopeptidase family serine peptidase [Pseudobutyrivibrio sp.]